MHCTIIQPPNRIRYEPAYRLQMQLVDRIKQSPGEPHAYVILLEHEPVLTLGRRSDSEEFRVPREYIERQGIEIHEIDRGGKITYHGPGQIVGYPIIPLLGERRDVHKYMRSLEQVILNTLAEYGIEARREPDFTGVWVGDEKVAAIGIGLTRWITFHGFALNVNTDLDAFKLITPCGIADRGVTSMKNLLGRDVDQQQVCERLIEAIQQEFQFESITRETMV